MSTHDYVIDNQSAPAFRADLNSALQAIVTQNSNATAPSVTYANMIWYDTTNNQLKKRNEANSAWITLGTIDETLGTFTQSGERSFASQAEAEAGTNTTNVMNPLRTAQAIAALTPPDSLKLLGTLTTTSGTTQTLSSLVLTPYSALIIFVDGTSHNGGTNASLQLGTAVLQANNRAAASLISGSVVLLLNNGSALGIVDTDAQTFNARLNASGYTTASTSISFTWSNGAAFDAGKITVYGVRA